jgi:hypothetical protein
MVYYLGPQNKLEFRAARDIQWDMQVDEYQMNKGAHSVKDIKDAVMKRESSGKK